MNKSSLFRDTTGKAQVGLRERAGTREEMSPGLAILVSVSKLSPACKVWSYLALLSVPPTSLAVSDPSGRDFIKDRKPFFPCGAQLTSGKGHKGAILLSHLSPTLPGSYAILTQQT